MTEPFPRGPRFLGITPGFAAGLYGTAVLAVAVLAFGRYLEDDRFALLDAFALGLPLLPPLLLLSPTLRPRSEQARSPLRQLCRLSAVVLAVPSLLLLLGTLSGGGSWRTGAAAALLLAVSGGIFWLARTPRAAPLSVSATGEPSAPAPPASPPRLVILQVLGVVLGLIAALGLIALPGKIAGYGGTFDTTEGVEGAYILALVLVLGPAVPLVIPAFRRASPLWQAAVRRVTRFGGLALAFAAAFPAVMSIAMGFIYWQVLGAWVIVGLGVLIYWRAGRLPLATAPTPPTLVFTQTIFTVTPTLILLMSIMLKFGHGVRSYRHDTLLELDLESVQIDEDEFFKDSSHYATHAELVAYRSKAMGSTYTESSLDSIAIEDVSRTGYRATAFHPSSMSEVTCGLWVGTAAPPPGMPKAKPGEIHCWRARPG